MKRSVFYSFHYDRDSMRASQVRQIGALESNEPVSANDWEAIKSRGDPAVGKWIDEQLKGTSCAVVLIGTETDTRPWVKREIVKAWNARKGVVGIYIHNLKDPNTGQCAKGGNPFDKFTLRKGALKMSAIVKDYDPPSSDSKAVYAHIADNIAALVEEAIVIRTNYTG